MLYTNSFNRVTKAKDKLRIAIVKKYPDIANETKFNIGIDPENGRYTILLNLKNKLFASAIPESVDGYRVVIDGITRLTIPPGIDI